MGMSKGVDPRYRANHSEKQAAYCQSKLDLLRNYSNLKNVQISPNLGWGTSVARFWTLQSPIFEFLRCLCYRPDPERPGLYLKTVTQEWVDQLNWRQVAWWYQDDGCKQSRQMVFATHSFTKEECLRLVKWLTDHGVAAEVRRVRKRETYYWNVRVLSEASVALANHIRPFMHPSMRYKLPESKDGCPCLVCGKIVPPTFGQGSSVQLCSDECRVVRQRSHGAKYYEQLTPQDRKDKLDSYMARLKEDPERYAKWRAYHAEKQREKFTVPEKIEKHKSWKKAYRARRKAEGSPEKKNQIHTCIYCADKFLNSGTHKMSKRSPFISCAKPECMAKRIESYADLRRAKAREKWAAAKA